MNLLPILTLATVAIMSHHAIANNTIDPLPSWNDTATKRQGNHSKYVQQTTNPDSIASFLLVSVLPLLIMMETLWAEKPAYFQLYFAF